MLVGYLAIDQFRLMIRLKEPKHPRKQLLKACGRKSCRKMYVDRKDGSSRHAGYIVGSQWFHLYEVHEWAGKGNDWGK